MQQHVIELSPKEEEALEEYINTLSPEEETFIIEQLLGTTPLKLRWRTERSITSWIDDGQQTDLWELKFALGCAIGNKELIPNDRTIDNDRTINKVRECLSNVRTNNNYTKEAALICCKMILETCIDTAEVAELLEILLECVKSDELANIIPVLYQTYDKQAKTDELAVISLNNLNKWLDSSVLAEIIQKKAIQRSWKLGNGSMRMTYINDDNSAFSVLPKEILHTIGFFSASVVRQDILEEKKETGFVKIESLGRTT